MKTKNFLTLFFMVVVLSFLFCLKGMAATDDPRTPRPWVKNAIESIARFIDQNKHRARGVYGVVYGNIRGGNAGISHDRESLDNARSGAFKTCQETGGGCEELFSVRIHNHTSKTVRLYLYVPWETDFISTNALWTWTFPPGHDSNLAIDGCLLFIPKSLYFRVEYQDGSKDWEAKKISELNFTRNYFQTGQNLWLRLVDRSN